jgi:hypothetical protein
VEVAWSLPEKSTPVLLRFALAAPKPPHPQLLSMTSTPNFLIAGGVATGTSFLSAALANHPDIYLPRIQRPEPNFFHYTHKFEQGIDWYLATWFHEVSGQRAIGERSSLLLPSDQAAKRIKAHFPDIKLIFCLRNPIERAWGNYRFSVLEGLESLSFEDALDQENKRKASAAGRWAEVQPHAYTTRSKYAKHLGEYLDLFGSDNILMIKSEAMGKDPYAHIRRVCEFLGVDYVDNLPLPPNYSSPSVVDRDLQPVFRKHFGDNFPEVIEAIRKEEDGASFVRSREDQEMFEKLRANLRGGKDPLPETSRLRLREYFADELAVLEKIVPFPVNDWQ